MAAARTKAPAGKAAAKKPATGRTAAKPADKQAKSAKAPTRMVAKPAKTSKPDKRETRHEKPGTGRTQRNPALERTRSGSGERRAATASAAAVSAYASPFNKSELQEWRKLLLEHRAEIAQDISHLEQGAMEAEDGHTTPNHLAERGSDAEMQDLSLGLAGEEQVVIWQIDRALRKIDNGSPMPFGLCEHTKQAIPKTRLQLIPWTPVSIEGMNYVEENGLTLEDVLADG
jgi:RNA polymerase-binding transcription factor DksA